MASKLHYPISSYLTVQDRMVMNVLEKDCNDYDTKQKPKVDSALPTPNDSDGDEKEELAKHAEFGDSIPADTSKLNVDAIKDMKAFNDPGSYTFDPTVFVSFDLPDIKVPSFVQKWILDPYVAWAKTIVRHDTDVVMLTHLLLYLITTIPSALYLFYDFHWWHGAIHYFMQVYFMGPYTLMMHQHIHMRGILSKKYWLLDTLFPYVTDPLMGHTWNSYYFHHVKHHHIEANGPDDLSSTVRYQRDDIWNFLHYLGRFYFLIWWDLPRYFLRKRKPGLAMKAGTCEILSYMALFIMFTRVNRSATVFVYLLPLMTMRLGLMIGNWGQHAFVDETEPDSDFRSSITLIDIASNRYCYNDGYHTSHHLNPLRHWRDHPIHFLEQKHQYANQHALVFYNIDYLMVTVSLLTKNYDHLAKCMVPMGEQRKMSLEERAQYLQSRTRRFTEEEIAQKWGAQYTKKGK